MTIRVGIVNPGSNGLLRSACRSESQNRGDRGHPCQGALNDEASG